MDRRELTFLAIDGDDTLWVTEPYYQEALAVLRSILLPYLNGRDIQALVYRRERANLPLFGYGAKGFTLSMVETACQVSDYRLGGRDIEKIIAAGKDILSRSMEVLPEVPETLEQLSETYPLTLITKGDLLDQQRKIARSGLSGFFERIEIVPEKDESTYLEILSRYGVPPERLVMVGDSMKSDVLPVVNIGGTAVHVPCQASWVHESVDDPPPHHAYHIANRIGDVPRILETLESGRPS